MMQEKADDSESDILSLGSLIYELCALKSPFRAPETQLELRIFIRYVRIFLSFSLFICSIGMASYHRSLENTHKQLHRISNPR